MQLTFSAVPIGEKIKPRGLNIGEKVNHLPYCARLGENQWVVVYRFGVLVSVGLGDKERLDVISELQPFVGSPLEGLEPENLCVNTGYEKDEYLEDELYLNELTREYVLMVADILAKSVMLNRFELDMAKVFIEIEPLAHRLEQGKITISPKSLVRRIGSSLLVKQRMIGSIEVNDKPEVLWDYPEMEKLYLTLEGEYEIRERHQLLEKKLSLITTTAETQLELLHNKHSLRVEWYIVILIVVEILLTLYEMFIRHV
ncbi:RMD1 family protein [Limisalsivibrio acetivorans]|uniref:RMD1 family protein n=1 Tax=Limisalsivibrio acetivorans TaxID=1304888 RepID=UPI0003B6911E|nr:RMD1 family protein [Limisalsivibrio acetivorans]